MAQKIIFTGGGSAGHVVPNLAIIDKALQEGFDVAYIGSHAGVERGIIKRYCAEKYSHDMERPVVGCHVAKSAPRNDGLFEYHPIASGKLRRYFSWKNFIDPFKVLFGLTQSLFILSKEKPVLVFSKGGFVSLPVVIAAWLKGIPVVAHESDLSPGLANRLSLPFVKALCMTFPDALKHIKSKARLVVTGTPIRKEFFNADADRGRAFLRFNADKKILLIIGGGLGATTMNEVAWSVADDLVKTFQVVHICGTGKMNAAIQNESYRQFEYIHQEIFDVMAATDIVISRAGANSLCEFIALKKPHILIPLKQGSRGDQVLNARYFEKLGLSAVLAQEGLTGKILLAALNDLHVHFAERKAALDAYHLPDAVEAIWKVILDDTLSENN